MYVGLGGRNLFERNIRRVKRPLLGKLLTSLAVSYSSFVYKKPQSMVAAVFAAVTIDCHFVIPLRLS